MNFNISHGAGGHPFVGFYTKKCG